MALCIKAWIEIKYSVSYLFDETLITYVEKEDGEITNPSVKHQQFEVDRSMQGRRERGNWNKHLPPNHCSTDKVSWKKWKSVDLGCTPSSLPTKQVQILQIQLQSYRVWRLEQKETDSILIESAERKRELHLRVRWGCCKGRYRKEGKQSCDFWRWHSSFAKHMSKHLGSGGWKKDSKFIQEAWGRTGHKGTVKC